MGGKKKGGGGQTPYEAPDNLKSAQELRAIGLISLGPIRGAATEDQYQSIFFDHTPLKNQQGEWNFKNTEIQYTLGHQEQEPLKGFEMSEREVSVGAEVKLEHPISRQVIDPDITRLRITVGVQGLYHQNDKGDTHGTSVAMQVLINGKVVEGITINGKSSSRFYRSYLIDDLPPVPFTVTIKRLTADSKSQRLQNGTFWSSYTEIIDTKLSYPNMALVGIRTDSRYNPNFPNMNFLLYGRLVKVPSNYNPDTRTYAAGIWKGDFKLAWTNNPAWVFYDLVTNKLAGLGQRVGDYGVDKFQLYQIAQYCDQLVPDGYGGQEPRMVANMWLTEQRAAYDVIADMASVFRAIVVWNGLQLTAIQDRPADPVYRFTQANVIGGKFTRQFAPLKTIFTAVEIEYADERNNYQKAIEYLADDNLIKRYGYNVKKMTAFACTSRGQARRYGKWVLETSRLEQCTISFGIGREGLAVLPGDIIEVADKTYANLNLGGRVLEVVGSRVKLDAPIELAENKESFLGYYNEASKRLVRIRILRTAHDDPQTVQLASEPEGLKPFDVWALHTPIVKLERYRVLSIAENQDGSYQVTALQHEVQKEAIVDNGAHFEPPVATVLRGGLLPVNNAEISTSGSGVHLSFTPPHFVGQGLKYQVKLYRDGELHKIYDDLNEPDLVFNDLPDGAYQAEIRAKNLNGQLSDPVTKSFEINFKVAELTTTSKIFGINLNWRNPIFANPNSAIELWVSKDNQFQNARQLVTLAYPTSSYSYDGLGVAERFYFWARMVDPRFNTAGEFTEAVEGITEESAEKLVDYLEGQLTESTLGSALVNSLVGKVAGSDEISGKFADLSSRLQHEANARAAAIQEEARQRGTAIRRMEEAQGQQASQIEAAFAKADNALAGLQTERQARAGAEQANAKAISDLNSKLNGAESVISSVTETVSELNRSTTQQFNGLTAKFASKGEVTAATAKIEEVKNAVADANGKVATMHTIKTETLAGGRKAVAGIAIGAEADNKAAESSVIVMADKFGVVRNAQDGTVKPIFTTSRNSIGINGDLITKGSITGNHIQANTKISAPNIQGGSINIGNGKFMVDKNGNLTANSGVFKGRLEGATGFFSGTLEVKSLVGGNLFEYHEFPLKLISSEPVRAIYDPKTNTGGSLFEARLQIAAHPAKRVIVFKVEQWTQPARFMLNPREQPTPTRYYNPASYNTTAGTFVNNVLTLPAQLSATVTIQVRVSHGFGVVGSAKAKVTASVTTDTPLITAI